MRTMTSVTPELSTIAPEIRCKTLQTPEMANALRLRASFSRDAAARDLRATLTRLDGSVCEVHVYDTSALRTDRGDIHPAVRASLAELAAGYAAAACAPAGASLITMEQSLELGSPHNADHLIVTSRLDRNGRSLLILRTELVGELGGKRRTLALLTSTILVMRDKTAAVADKVALMSARAAA